MALTRTSSNGIVAISVSLIDNYDIVFLQLLQKNIEEMLGLPPATVNTLRKQAESINNNGSL